MANAEQLAAGANPEVDDLQRLPEALLLAEAVEAIEFVGDAIERRDGRAGLILRVAFLPARVLWTAITTSARLGWYAGRLPIRAGAATKRALGWRAIVLLVAGVAIGVLFAPKRGAEIRDRIRRMITGGGLTDAELADRVEFELSHAPRTWHLPQPEVAVLNGHVELRGSVPHPVGRDEIERVASAVPGVTEVDNLLVITDQTPSSN